MPSTSPDNILYPGLDDVGDDMPAVLGPMASSIQAAISALRAEVAATQAQSTIAQATFGTAASGVSVTAFGLRRRGNAISGSMKLEKASGTFGHADTVFTVNAAYRTAAGVILPLPAIGSGGAASQPIGATLQANGTVVILNPGTRNTLEIAIDWLIP